MGDSLKATIAKYFDNSLENIGRGNSVSPDCYFARMTVLSPAVDIPWSSVGSGSNGSFEDVQRCV